MFPRLPRVLLFSAALFAFAGCEATVVDDDGPVPPTVIDRAPDIDINEAPDIDVNEAPDIDINEQPDININPPQPEGDDAGQSPPGSTP